MILMCASGVLFLSEKAVEGRRWIMPMRLPRYRPAEVASAWQEALADTEARSECEQLGFF